MALAEVFEALAGPGCPGGVHGLRRQSRRSRRIAGQDHGPLTGGRGLPRPGPGRLGLARAYVAGHLDVEGDMYEALARMTKAQSSNLSLAEKLRLLQALGGPKLLRAPDAAATAGGHAAPPLAGRPAALQDPRRQGDLAPLRRVQPVLRVGARAVDGVHLRLLPPRGRDPGGGAGEQVRPGRPQARARRGHAAARRRLRLGRHGDARGAGVRRQGARRHAVRPAGRVGAGRDRARGAVRARRGAAPGLPRRAGDRLRRGQLDRPDRAHRQAEPAVLLLVPVRQARSRRPAAEPLHHPAGQHRARHPQGAGSSTATSSPTASSRAPAT